MTATGSDVRLAPLCVEHATAMTRWLNDAHVRENLGVRKQVTLNTTREWLERVVVDPAVQGWGIYVEDQHVGNVVLDLIDPELQTARLSVYVGEDAARGRGAGRRGTALALDHAFGGLNLNKVWLIVHTENLPAIRTYAKLGFRVEGVLQEEFLLRGTLVSVLRMAIFRSQWLRRSDGATG